MNDLPCNLKSCVKMFAEEHDCLTLQRDLDTIASWCSSWQMKLNPSKCEALCISNKRSPPLFQYNYGDHVIKWTDAIRYLGVTFNTHLTWNHHCKSVASKATNCFNVLGLTIFDCSIKAKSIAFSALVLPILEYASPVWSTHSKQNTKLLESILHRGAGCVCNSHYDRLYHHWTPSFASCCKTLRWKSLSFRRNVSALVTAHDITHDRSFIPQNSLPLIARSHSKHKSLQCHLSSSNCYRHSFFIRIPFMRPTITNIISNPCLRKVFTHCHRLSCNSWLVSVFMFVVTLLCCNA